MNSSLYFIKVIIEANKKFEDPLLHDFIIYLLIILAIPTVSFKMYQVDVSAE